MLASKLAGAFGAGVRSRGESYYLSGRAKVIHRDGDREFAVSVRGSEPYGVTIEIDSSRPIWEVGVACTCPFIESYGEFCKHIWAGIKAVDEATEFRMNPSKARVSFIDDETETEPETVEEQLSVEERRVIAEDTKRRWAEYREGLRVAKTGTRATARAKRRAESPRWESLVTAVRNTQRSAEPVRRRPARVFEPYYVVEGESVYGSPAIALTLLRRSIHKADDGRLVRYAMQPSGLAELSDARDRTALRMLFGAVPGAGFGYYWGSEVDQRPAQDRWLIPVEAAREVMPALFETGRVLFRAKMRDERPTGLSWDGGGPWEFVLAFNTDSPGEHRMEGELRRGAERIALSDVERVYPGNPAVFVRGARMGIVESQQSSEWLKVFQGQKAYVVREKERAAFLESLAAMGSFPRIEWPAEWNVRQESAGAPRPTLQLSREVQYYVTKREHSQAKVTFRYGEQLVEAGRPGNWVVDAAGGRLIERQMEEERRLYNRLFELGVKLDSNARSLRVMDRRVPAMVSALLKEGWEVTGEKGLFRTGGKVSIEAGTGIDWFELKGRVDFGGASASLPEILEAARRGEQFVRLGDGSMGMLPEEWLRQHGALLELGTVEDGSIRFATTQVGLLDALLSAMPEARFDKALAKARERLGSFAGIRGRAAPAGFKGKLRTYQKEGLGWLRFLNEFGWAGCLADDMGLGKTIQVLALLLDRKREGGGGPALVVAPKSVVFNWIREAERFTPSLKVLNYTGLDRKKAAAEIGSADVVVTTYGTMRQDIEALREREFEYAILDEAQAIKNPASQSAKAARLLRAKHRLAMTGTPVENRLGDLWSLFDFLNPGMLGTTEAFRKAFESREENGDAKPTPALARMLRPFILRRTKELVAPELPARVEQTIECDLGAEQRKTYDDIRGYYRSRVLDRVDSLGMNKSRMHVLEALLRLRQAACHPGLLDAKRSGHDSAKLDALIPMIEEIVVEGHKALVFSQFTSFLGLLKRRLNKARLVYEYLDGKTRDRKARCDRFQTDAKCPLFLISLKAGGVGLNLTAADYVFILDPWWNPAVEAQAIDRTHRIGQKKRVIAYRIIARDTVESKILQLQHSKRDLAAAVINQSNSVVRDLTRDDLAMLLS